LKLPSRCWKWQKGIGGNDITFSSRRQAGADAVLRGTILGACDGKCCYAP